jgi:protein-tyrosine kinase
MNQHSALKPSASLLERAAAIYDFGAQMRAPVLPEPKAPPAPEPVEAVEADEEGSTILLLDRAVEAPALVAAPRRKRAGGRRAAVSRDQLQEAGYIVPDGPVTGLAEEFRIIKRQLLLGAAGEGSTAADKRRLILACSANPDEGKTFCAINLALSLAGEKDVEVLLVDGDFVKPEILSTLGIEGGAGLIDAICDPAADPNDYVIETDVEGLAVLPPGRHANDVTELLASSRTKDVFAALTANYPNRIIILDSPPALMASPASVLATHVGQVMMVVRADETPEADLREAIALLSGCDTVSLLLNGAAPAASSRRFGSYYGYGQ